MRCLKENGSSQNFRWTAILDGPKLARHDGARPCNRKFTHAHSDVTLKAYALGDRILMDVEYSCGNLRGTVTAFSPHSLNAAMTRRDSGLACRFRARTSKLTKVSSQSPTFLARGASSR